MERNKSLDGLKYCLIILVVLGHFIEPSRYNNQLSGWLYSCIYSFHMPLFIWMNGYFYKHRVLSEEIKKCIPLFEVCLISTVLFAYLKNGSVTIVNLINYGYTPTWYLLSLIFWRLMSSVLIVWFSIKKLFLISVLLELLTFIFVPRYGGFFSFVRTFQFYPFFLIGYVMKNKMTVLTKYKKPIILLGIFAIVYVLITSCRLQHQCFYQRAGLLELTRYTGHSLIELFIFRYSLVICSMLICAFILLITHKNVGIQRFAIYGQGTLFIYYGQTLLFPFANKYCTTLTLSIFATVIAIFVLTYISRKDISKWLMNPITMLLSYKKQ